MQSLFNQVERMGMNIEVLAPVHGQPVSWSEFIEALESLERLENLESNN